MSRAVWLSLAVIAIAALSSSALPGQSEKPQAPSGGKSEVPASHEWRDYAGSPEGTRYMPLTQINKSNVSQLEVAWTYPYAETQYNPVVAHGVIYTKARNKSLVAIDAETGKEIWIHDDLAGVTERGVNYWESKDGSDRRLIFCVGDYLQEIDARTGRTIRGFGKNGAVDLRDELGRDPNKIRVQSGTPGKVFENLIILGSAVGESFFSAPGDLRAYNILTGKLAWQFHTVPHPGEFGYDTWPKDAWKYIGGTNTWGEISVDSARGIAYFPTGSPTYDFYGADRLGANLFSDCLIALDARTGKRLWHFQNVHHDLWDYDNVAAPILTTIVHNGRKVDVVALAGKTGYLYVFDRVTGEPIWPIEEKPVSTQTDSPGEAPSPTQPFPTVPPPFTKHIFSADDVNPYVLTPEKRAQYKEQVAKAHYGGPFTPIAFEDVIQMPGNHGGANWGMTSANPNDGTAYVMAFNTPAIIRLGRPAEARPGRGAGGAAAGGPGEALYLQNCAACHNPDRSGGLGPNLVNLASRMSAAQIRTMIGEGKGQMPSFHQLSNDDIDLLVSFLSAPGAEGGGGFGRGGGPTIFPPGPIVESGPAAVRPASAAGRGGRGNPGSLASDYPEGVEHPQYHLSVISPGLGMDVQETAPPYTTFTAYDLNKGTIKWQIGLGDDYRVLAAGGPKGTGGDEFMKSSVIPTASGLLFVNAADRKVHIYDSETGKQLSELLLGATSSGSPSMYELKGRQYLLVTASPVGTRGFADDGLAADPRQTGPIGLIAYTLKSGLAPQ